MTSSRTRGAAFAAVLATALILSVTLLAGQEEFKFHSGVELVNVTATVTDQSGRFADGLQQSDFVVYEDNRPVEVTHFSAERVPVSLGIILDSSGSMAGEKLARARGAIDRFLKQLNADDEVFLVAFAYDVSLVQEWTTNRDAVSTSLRRVRAVGGTAMYDAVIESVPIAEGGRHRKKALILISDGNDSASRAAAHDVRRAVRETELLLYAVGIDGEREQVRRIRPPAFPPIPLPIPGRSRPRWPGRPQLAPLFGGGGPSARLNVAALRDITEASGGRTEIVRAASDLDRATAGIAEELSRQYYLGYASPGHRDGRWHDIRVDTRDPSLRVRARRGYVAASPTRESQ
jgi:Ca-activated chloride channel family protein